MSGPRGAFRVSIGSLMVPTMLLLFLLPGSGRLIGTGAAIAGPLAALPFVVILFVMTVLVNRGRLSRPVVGVHLIPLFLWTALLLVSILRSNNDNHAGMAGVLLTGLWAGIVVSSLQLAFEARRHAPPLAGWMLTGLAAAPAVFVAANVALQAVGIGSSQALLVDHPEGRMAAMLGIRLERTLLPLARGINNFGVVAGLALATSIASTLTPNRTALQRLAFGTLALSAVVALVFVDSRGPLLFGVIAGCAAPLAYRMRRGRILRWASLLAPLLPVILLALLTLVSRSELARSLSRKQGDVASATGRAVIWGAAAGRLATQPRALDAIGYGQYGAKGDGISAVWAEIFKDFEADPRLTSTHNFSLQLVYDIGYLGLAIVLALFWWAFSVLARTYDPRERPGAIAVAAGLLFILVAGTTEATLSIIFPESFVLFTLALSACAALAAPPARAARELEN